VQQCTERTGGKWNYLPSVQPRFAAQSSDVTWPTHEWPRGESVHQDELDAVVDEMFTDEDLALTNAVRRRARWQGPL